MRTFVDTSALYALMDEDDRNHLAAAVWFATADATEVLVSHGYVVVETAALVQRRLGAVAVRTLFDALVPAMSIVYVDEVLHGRAVAAFLAGLRRHVSFVDWVSFQLIRDAGLDRAFAFDSDFAREGFTVVPRD
jgi:predicted nucleic acid-binding protein